MNRSGGSQHDRTAERVTDEGRVVAIRRGQAARRPKDRSAGAQALG
jgi:hypothetical protein